MDFKAELEKTASYLRTTRKAIIGRGGEISATAGLKDLPLAIFNIPADASLAFYEDSTSAYKKTVPTNVAEYALIKKIGGRSYTTVNLFNPKIATFETTYTDWYWNEEYQLYCRASKCAYTSKDAEGKTIYIYEDSAESAPKCEDADSPYFGGVDEAAATTKYAGITWTIYADGTITAQGNLGDMFSGSTLDLSFSMPKEKTQYTISGYGFTELDGFTYEPYCYDDLSSTEYMVANGDDEGNAGARDYIRSLVDIFVSSQSYDAYNCMPRTVNETFKIMITEGDTDLPWEAYFEGLKETKCTALNSTDTEGNIVDTFDVPAAVRVFDGYGMGVDNDYNNHIEWQDNKCYYVKPCVKMVLNGSEDWTPVGNTYFALTLGEFGKVVPNICICDKYKISTVSQNVESGITTINSNGFSDSRIIFRPNGFTVSMSVDDLKAQLAASPVTLIYALTTPTETDITDLITKDNFIKVTGGGSIIAVNADEKAAQTTIKYTQKTEG